MSWDALLKNTKVELELMTDIYMDLLMEKCHVVGSRCYQEDLSRPTTQWPQYDSLKPNNWIINFDANNLYDLDANNLYDSGGQKSKKNILKFGSFTVL